MTSGEKTILTRHCRRMGRRDSCSAGLATTVACLFPYKAAAVVAKVFPPERTLSFHSAHTGEQMKTVYWQDGTYVPQALADINYICRDYRTGGVKDIDTALLDLLFGLLQELESTGPLHIISGYRSMETNSLLHMLNAGVAKNSLHMQGKAIDIRLPGHELKALRTAAVALRRGGVGYYPSSDFVHVDVGRVRTW